MVSFSKENNNPVAEGTLELKNIFESKIAKFTKRIEVFGKN